MAFLGLASSRGRLFIALILLFGLAEGVPNSKVPEAEAGGFSSSSKRSKEKDQSNRLAALSRWPDIAARPRSPLDNGRGQERGSSDNVFAAVAALSGTGRTPRRPSWSGMYRRRGRRSEIEKRSAEIEPEKSGSSFSRAQAVKSSWSDYDYEQFDDGGMSAYRPPTNDVLGGNTEVITLGNNKEDPNWHWCLLTFDGNETIIQLRRDDFIRYVRMNLASLIGSDYDSVIFNSVSYVPEILVNVTLDWNGRAERIVKVLGNLAKHNDTLLDLSGSHFNVTSFVPWSEILAPKPVAPLENAGIDPSQVEALVFTAVGAAIAFLLISSLVFAVCQCASRRKNNKNNKNNAAIKEFTQERQLRRCDGSRGPLLGSQYSLEDVPGCSESGSNNCSSSGRQHRPKVIYSQSFSDGLNHASNGGRRRCFTPIDEGGGGGGGVAAPLASFDEWELQPRNRPRLAIHRYSEDSQSDIIAACGTPQHYQPQLPPERPFSVMSNNSHTRMRATPHSHRHCRQDTGARRRSRGGYLPMGPVFQTVAVNTAQVMKAGESKSTASGAEEASGSQRAQERSDRDKDGVARPSSRRQSVNGISAAAADRIVPYNGVSSVESPHPSRGVTFTDTVDGLDGPSTPVNGTSNMMSHSMSFSGVPPPPPMELTFKYQPPPRMTSFKSPATMTQEEIDRDVQIVLHNLGLDNPK